MQKTKLVKIARKRSPSIFGFSELRPQQVRQARRLDYKVTYIKKLPKGETLSKW